jgi:hypothetical protein
MIGLGVGQNLAAPVEDQSLTQSSQSFVKLIPSGLKASDIVKGSTILRIQPGCLGIIVQGRLALAEMMIEQTSIVEDRGIERI